jgi:hypothetical protein
MLLQSPKRFQSMCVRLARRRFPDAIPVHFGSWDGGADVVDFGSTDTDQIIWQCKFTANLGSSTKRSIRESLRSLDHHYLDSGLEDDAQPTIKTRWILCIPVDPTGAF